MAWNRFFHWIAKQSGVELEVIAHAAPAPLSELWARPDMGAVFMCGFPFSRLAADERPLPLAAPVSLADWAKGHPVYASHIVAARESPLKEADLVSARWGWTVRDSQSGYNAPREFFATLAGGQPTRETIGSLLNPRGVVDAIRSDTIDVGAIDAYAYQLLALHEPDMVAPLRIVATTRPAPFPLLVAARQQPPEIVEALRGSLLSAHRDREGLALLAALGLARFAEPDIDAYDRLPARARAIDEVLGPW